MRKRNERVRASITILFNKFLFLITAIARWKHAIPSDLASQATLGLTSTFCIFYFQFFFRIFKVLMDYYSCKSFEKKNFFLSTKKLNFNELLTHKRYEKNIFISSKKIFLSSNHVGIKVIWIKVWFHLVRQIVWAQNQFIKMVNWKIYHWKIMARIICIVF